MRCRLRVVSVLALAVAASAWNSVAYADYERGGDVRGGGKGDALTAKASQTKVKLARSGGSGTRELIPANADWSPPPCWYEPMGTPRQFKENVRQLKESGVLAWSIRIFGGVMSCSRIATRRRVYPA